MSRIVELQIFYRRVDNDKVEKISAVPCSQDSAGVKLDIARVVHQLRTGKNAQYYYVVMKVRKTDGSDGYRTIVPKTLVIT